MLEKSSKKTLSNDPMWIMNEQHTLKFPLSEKLHKLKFSYDTLFDHPIASIILSLFCVMVDLVLLYRLMSVVYADNMLIVIMGVIGLAVPMDVGPAIVGKELIKLEQGIETDPRKQRNIQILVYAFVVAVFINMILRILLKTKALPLTSDVAEGYVALTWSNVLWGSIVPILTSVVLYCVSYATTDPLKNKIQNAEKRALLMKEHIRQLEGSLAEYIPQDEYRAQLIANDDQFCLNKLDRIDEKCLSLCYYVRKRLKEHLGDPSDISELSVDIRDQIMAKLFSENKRTEPLQIVESDAVFSAIN